MDDSRTDTSPIPLKRIHRKLSLSCTVPLLWVFLVIDPLSPKVTPTTAGLFSSFVSHLVTTRFLYPRLVSKLVQPDKTGSPGMMHKLSSSLSSAAKSSARPATDAAAATPTILPSLGASGAIYSTVIMSTLAFPEAEVSLVFPPTPSFPIQYGVGGMVLLDCIGILRGWRYGHIAADLVFHGLR
jgi:hypothetical protein